MRLLTQFNIVNNSIVYEITQNYQVNNINNICQKVELLSLFLSPFSLVFVAVVGVSSRFSGRAYLLHICNTCNELLSFQCCHQTEKIIHHLVTMHAHVGTFKFSPAFIHARYPKNVHVFNASTED